MKSSLSRLPGGHLLIAGAFAFTASTASADLIGDTIFGEIQGGPGAFEVVPPSNIVGDGVEFTIEFVGTPAFEINIGSTSFHLYSVFGQAISTGAGEVLVLSDLDGVGGNLKIIGITNFMTNEGPDITEDDVTWTDTEIRFNMSPNIWAADGFVSFDIVFVPAPSALALLGVAGLVGRSRRRR